jgi:hypothetical protein
MQEITIKTDNIEIEYLRHERINEIGMKEIGECYAKIYTISFIHHDEDDFISNFDIENFNKDIIYIFIANNKELKKIIGKFIALKRTDNVITISIYSKNYVDVTDSSEAGIKKVFIPVDQNK